MNQKITIKMDDIETYVKFAREYKKIIYNDFTMKRDFLKIMIKFKIFYFGVFKEKYKYEIKFNRYVFKNNIIDDGDIFTGFNFTVYNKLIECYENEFQSYIRKEKIKKLLS